jgi:ribonuclease HII
MRVGIDEAGRGPLLGPLVVAGVATDDEEALRALGVRDSKKLTAARREALAAQIRQNCETALVVLSAADIDDGRKTKTLNDLEVSAFAAVGRRLQGSEYILDAADVEADRFGRAFLGRLGRSPSPSVLSLHKADALHPVVSAASIIAKVERDRHVEVIARRLRQEIGMPLGSGYPSDPDTVAFLAEYVRLRGSVPVEFRSSWKPVQEALARTKVRPLTEF